MSEQNSYDAYVVQKRTSQGFGRKIVLYLVADKVGKNKNQR